MYVCVSVCVFFAVVLLVDIDPIFKPLVISEPRMSCSAVPLPAGYMISVQFVNIIVCSLTAIYIYSFTFQSRPNWFVTLSVLQYL